MRITNHELMFLDYHLEGDIWFRNMNYINSWTFGLVSCFLIKNCLLNYNSETWAHDLWFSCFLLNPLRMQFCTLREAFNKNKPLQCMALTPLPPKKCPSNAMLLDSLLFYFFVLSCPLKSCLKCFLKHTLKYTQTFQDGWSTDTQTGVQQCRAQ